MISTCSCLRVCVSLALLLTPVLASAQGTGPASRVQVAAGGGFLTSGSYFTGPGGAELTNGNAFAGVLQVTAAVHRAVAVVLAGAHARPTGTLTNVPLIGSLDVPGVRLWFADASLRGQIPLRPASGAVVFAQAGAGFAHYAIATSLLNTQVDEHATNLALTLGAGLVLPLTRRLGVEVMAKDYIASFRGVRDLAAFGIEGRRAHTVLLVVSARLGL